MLAARGCGMGLEATLDKTFSRFANARLGAFPGLFAWQAVVRHDQVQIHRQSRRILDEQVD
jgi:hypothetical protein